MRKTSAQSQGKISTKAKYRFLAMVFTLVVSNLFDSRFNANANPGANMSLPEVISANETAQGRHQSGRPQSEYFDLTDDLNPVKSGYADASHHAVAQPLPHPLSQPLASWTAAQPLPLAKVNSKAVSSTGLRSSRKPNGSVPNGSVNGNEIFGATRIGFGKIATGQRFSAYAKSLQEAQGNVTTLCTSSKCEYRLSGFQNHIDSHMPDFLAKLSLVNRFVNKSISYAEDRTIYGQIDKWSLPHETLTLGAGDCEDLAILKMGMLSKLGVPKRAMSIIVLQDTSRDLYHAVLAVQTKIGTFILDNVSSTVRKDVEIANYRPLFSIGSSRNHVFGYKRGESPKVASMVDFAQIVPQAHAQ